MIVAGITIALLVVLLITIRLIAKSLYREKKPAGTIHVENRVRAKVASRETNTTTS
jgi:hypothetical protein